MELPKFLLGDNTKSNEEDIFVIHTEFPRFVINLKDDEIEMWKDLLDDDTTLNWSRWSLRIVLICGLLFIGRWLKSCCRRIDDQPPRKRKQN